MRILITIDDGIFSSGIIRLANAAQDFGEVFVIAPESLRSVLSHSIKGIEIQLSSAKIPVSAGT